MIINSIKICLEDMSKIFTDLSKLQFDDIPGELKEKLQEQKIQERPFAYEFYHQFRKLWDGGSILSLFPEDIVIQAEVNKRYQEIPHLNKIPDVLIHKPNSTDQNFAVIEFKLASNCGDLKKDFDKLVAFKQKLNYNHLIEVVIGNKETLVRAERVMEELNGSSGEEIDIIYFNTDSWRATDTKIKYTCDIN
jgi:hypothetical protein